MASPVPSVCVGGGFPTVRKQRVSPTKVDFRLSRPPEVKRGERFS